MAHDISKTADGRDMMFYFGQTPWHGLGKKLAKPATAEEAIIAAGLDWTVDRKSIIVAGSEVPGWKALVRSDIEKVLSVQKETYTPIQNVQAFGFFDALIGTGSAIYHTAGGLGQGERIWILAKLPNGGVEIERSEGKDRVEKYLLLFNSHDGSSALRMLFTPVRVVCANTLAMALQGRDAEGIAIRHTVNALERAAEAQRALGLAMKFYDDFGEQVNRLAGVKVTAKVARDYFKELVPDNPDAKKHTRTANIRKALMHTFRHGKGNDLPGIRGTWWAAFNGVTEFVDHHRRYRGKTNADKSNSRMKSVIFGSGAQAKRKAWNLALDMAGVAAG